MPQAPKQNRGVARGAIKCWVWMLVLFLLLALALLLTAFLTSNHVKVKYTIAGKSEVWRSRYGIWTACTAIGSAGEVCQDTKGYGPPFDTIHSREILILYLVSICLFLPSAIGLIMVAIHVRTSVLSVLVFITTFGSFGTLVAALGLFTWKVEQQLAGARTLGTWTFTQTGVEVTYWWSYMLAWIAAGVLLITLLNMIVLLCCQRRIRDEAEAEAKLQVRERDEKGLYNPSYKAGSSLKAKRATYPVVLNDDEFHYNSDTNTFQTPDVPLSQAHTNGGIHFDSPTTSHRNSPREIRLQEEMFYRPNPPSNEMFKHQETIELRPRMVHQPTPFRDDISPDYPTEDEDRTYTVSQVIPASGAESGLKLEVGDTYLVSLNQQ